MITMMNPKSKDFLFSSMKNTFAHWSDHGRGMWKQVLPHLQTEGSNPSTSCSRTLLRLHLWTGPISWSFFFAPFQCSFFEQNSSSNHIFLHIYFHHWFSLRPPVLHLHVGRWGADVGGSPPSSFHLWSFRKYLVSFSLCFKQRVKFAFGGRLLVCHTLLKRRRPLALAWQAGPRYKYKYKYKEYKQREAPDTNSNVFLWIDFYCF